MSELLTYITGLSEDAKVFLSHAWRITLILVLAWMLQRIARRLIRAFRIYMQQRYGDGEEARRIETLERVFRYTSTVVIAIVAGTLVLGELGISVAPILATAGVAGIAIGFGAQSLIKDYFNGFFILLEDQIRQGDVVQLGQNEGNVEEVTLRYVRLRDLNGHVHFVPNGEIKVVINRTREFAYALIEVGVAYRENIDEVLEVMRDVGKTMRADADWAARITEDIEILGVQGWGDSAVTIRGRLRVVPPTEQWNVRREFLRRLKAAFDTHGIEIPYPHLTIYPGQLKDGSAPPFSILNRP